MRTKERGFKVGSGFLVVIDGAKWVFIKQYLNHFKTSDHSTLGMAQIQNVISYLPENIINGSRRAIMKSGTRYISNGHDTS
ncbi:MAG: hypothetical protein IPL22_00820 [Bacteroidetes bacterium]|nr:hypothetical protein [Bacteroidota bacterium]